MTCHRPRLPIPNFQPVRVRRLGQARAIYLWSRCPARIQKHFARGYWNTACRQPGRIVWHGGEATMRPRAGAACPKLIRPSRSGTELVLKPVATDSGHFEAAFADPRPTRTRQTQSCALRASSPGLDLGEIRLAENSRRPEWNRPRLV